MDEKLVYLQMIQGVINRLASTSASFKGLAVTLFTGVLAVVFSLGNNNRVLVLVLSCIGLLAIAGFDCWYFRMERRYRKLYDLVLSGDHPVNFDMRNDESIEVRWCEVVSSKAVWLFYLVLIGVYVVLIAFSTL